MKVTDLTRRLLAFRREQRSMLAQGYKLVEVEWQFHRGATKYCKEGKVTDVKVCIDNQHLWIKTNLEDLQ